MAQTVINWFLHSIPSQNGIPKTPTSNKALIQSQSAAQEPFFLLTALHSKCGSLCLPYVGNIQRPLPNKSQILLNLELKVQQACIINLYMPLQVSVLFLVHRDNILFGTYYFVFFLYFIHNCCQEWRVFLNCELTMPHLPAPPLITPKFHQLF